LSANSKNFAADAKRGNAYKQFGKSGLIARLLRLIREIGTYGRTISMACGQLSRRVDPHTRLDKPLLRK